MYFVRWTDKSQRRLETQNGWGRVVRTTSLVAGNEEQRKRPKTLQNKNVYSIKREKIGSRSQTKRQTSKKRL